MRLAHLVGPEDQLLGHAAAHADVDGRADLLPRLAPLILVGAQHLRAGAALAILPSNWGSEFRVRVQGDPKHVASPHHVFALPSE